jgi:acyl-CoA thioesterase-1
MTALLILALLIFGCNREAEDKKPDSSPAEMVETEFSGTIVALGDSLTAGLGVDEDLAYPAQLQRKLEADGHHYRVINAGVSGETTSGTLSRLEWVLTMKPDIVILEIGANDGLRGIDPAVPAKNLREIVRQLQENDIIVVFTGMKMVWNLGPVYTASFNAIYPQVADENDLIFMPFFLEDVATKRALNSEDGLHPNARGYEVVVKNLYPYVMEAIERHEKKRY